MKAEKRLEAKTRGGRTDGVNPGEDPDIAGIIPGPQPPREDQLLFADEPETPETPETAE